MAKPWARYEVGFIDHDKFRAISGNAICLWLEGKNYADAHLTDGLLPLREVKRWRFYSAKNVQLLTTSAGLKTSAGERWAPLWEPHDIGFRMHDYLDHNACREEVMQRMQDRKNRQELRKLNDRRRKTDERRRLAEEISSVSTGMSIAIPREALQLFSGHFTDKLMDTTADTGADVLRTSANCPPVCPQPVRRQTETETETEVQREKTLSVVPPKKPADPRVKEFLDWFQAEYKRRRHGADYLVTWNRDAALVKQMLGATDLARLKRLSQVLLSDKCDDEFIVQTDRGVPILKAKFNWLSERLAAWEAARGVARAE